jgi:hypothetical protein
VSVLFNAEIRPLENIEKHSCTQILHREAQVILEQPIPPKTLY